MSAWIGRLQAVQCRQHRSSVCAVPNGSQPPTSKDKQLKQRQKDQLIFAGVGVALTAVVFLALTVGREPIEDLVYGDLDGPVSQSAISFGDGVGAVLWAVALYFCTPLQLLLLFLGRIETDRPSDWVIRQLGVMAQQRVDDPDYRAPLSVRAAAIAVFALGGVLTSWAFAASLGDATWAVSTGIGACMFAGIYEVGRPQRFTPEEAQELDQQWQDFAGFANERLQRTGRCHESEVFKAFRREFAKYRTEEAVSEAILRDLVRNWHPEVDRTATGYYKNLSLRPRVDPFTGEMQGGLDASKSMRT
ncbi:hypothetical protein WJX72_001923 [[Myrmecia] bisecta]|uniref:Uncharacterized protein n=1 Tax=[Myrmecia] bisecta TaxID=41462 RepID=A0AAW1Q0A7_9CHLO